jgi:F0F1-type ATP synthase assembly protein I
MTLSVAIGFALSVLFIVGAAVFAIVLAARAKQTDNPAEQTRLESFVEAWINVGIGFGINFTANLLLLPHFAGATRLTLASNFVIGMIYTVISVVRSYVIRRWAQAHLRAFNKWLTEWLMTWAHRRALNLRARYLVVKIRVLTKLGRL